MNITYNLAEIDKVAEQVIKECKYKTLLFEGEMGAGKTTLIKALAKQLGITEITQSPTYGFVNIYESKEGIIINHFDLYRLQSEDEAYDIGLEEYFYEDHWNFVEWPGKAMSILPDKRILISLKKIDVTLRKLMLQTSNL